MNNLKTRGENMSKYHLILTILLIIFTVLLCFSACSKKQSEKETSINNDSNVTNVISEKINLTNNLNAAKDTSSEDLLKAFELKVQFNENSQKMEIQSKDDLLTDEELELLSSEDLNKYFSILLELDNNVIKNIMQYVIDNKIIDKLDANNLKNLFHKNYFIISYNSFQISGNLKILYDAVKNIEDPQLFDAFYFVAKNTLKNQHDKYVAQSLCTQLLEYFDNDSEKKQELQVMHIQINSQIIPYDELEENIQAFLKQANPQYANYEKNLEFYAHQKTENQLKNEENKYDYIKISPFEEINIELKINDMKNNIQNENSDTIDHYKKKLLEYEVYLNTYSNNLQQIKAMYLNMMNQ